jgi:hypothetical protein
MQEREGKIATLTACDSVENSRIKCAKNKIYLSNIVFFYGRTDFRKVES